VPEDYEFEEGGAELSGCNSMKYRGFEPLFPGWPLGNVSQDGSVPDSGLAPGAMAHARHPEMNCVERDSLSQP